VDLQCDREIDDRMDLRMEKLIVEKNQARALELGI